MKVFIVFCFIFFPLLSYSNTNSKIYSKKGIAKKVKTSQKTTKNKKKHDNFTYWYYKPEKIGARAFHNPLQFIIEGGLPGGKNLSNSKFFEGMALLFKKLKNPIPYINDYGWKKFIYYEFIPHRASPKNWVVSRGEGENWVPNYTWHLFGGGFRTRLMIEYFHYHNYEHPALWGWVTMYIMHIFNESTQQGNFIKLSESGKKSGASENDTIDPFPDLLFFDWVGGVIFSYDPINYLMTKYFHLSDWSYQSQINLATNRILNNGQIYWLRYQLFDSPFSLNWISGAKITAPGFSYEYKKDHYLSFGLGLSVNKISMDSSGNLIAGSTVYTFGFYYSIADNPILTITLSMPDYRAMKLHPKTRNEYNTKLYVNLYPTGLIKLWGMDLGLTFAYDRETYFLGVTNSNWPLGFIMGDHKPLYY